MAKRRSIKTRLYLYLLLAVLVILAISCVLTQHFTVSYGDQLLINHLTLWGTDLESTIAPYFVHFNFPGLDYRVNDILKNHPHDFLTLYNHDGKEILHRGIEVNYHPGVLPDHLALHKITQANSDYYILSIPVKTRDKNSNPVNIILGYILYGHSLLENDQMAARTRILILVSGFVLFLLAFAMVRFIIKRLTAPLNILKRGLETITQGDMSSRLPITGNDEFCFLTEKFNEMAERVESMLEEVETNKRDLEDQICQRTHALNETNQKLKEAVQKLKLSQHSIIQEETQKSLTSVVSGFAHEINNPLTGILGYIDLIEMNDKLTPQTQKRLGGIKDQAFRIKSIIDELNQLDPEIEKTKMQIDLTNLLEKLVKIISQKPENKEISFEKEFLDKPVIVMGNHFALWQVYEGVIANSIEAIRDRQIPNGKIHILLKKSTQPDYAITEINDNGGGVENLEKAFSPFYTTKNRSLKRGIGLSIAFNVVREHNGNIDIKNHGHGAMVSIYLPYLDSWESQEHEQKHEKINETF